MVRKRSVSSEEKSLWDKVTRNVSRSTSNNPDLVDYVSVEKTGEKNIVDPPKSAVNREIYQNLSEKISENPKNIPKIKKIHTNTRFPKDPLWSPLWSLPSLPLCGLPVVWATTS